MTAGARIALHAVAVTYRRPAVLVATLKAFAGQTRSPDSVLVVDNDDDPMVRHAVEGLDRVSYLPMPANLGPAGAIACGMRDVLERADQDDWILLIDDDDPPRFETAVEAILAVAEQAPDDVAVVGLTGARYGRWSGRLWRVPDDELGRLTDVDYVGNGQCPVYRAAALRSVGVFDPALFFQFEELEFGLRLRRSGWRLVIDRDVTMRLRAETGRLGLGRVSRLNRTAAPWRTYYAARNEVRIARRHGAVTAPIAVTVRQLAGGLVRTVSLRSTGPLRWRARGVRDGWSGRGGRTVEPTS